MTNNTYKFGLKNWSAWGIGELSDIDDLSNIKHGMPSLDGIGAMVKRRMPKLSKYIYALTHETDSSDENIPTVFVSKNAELTRTFKIIRSFDADVSPTQFSMSVHNAIAGLLSVITEDNSIYTVIDSLSGTLETAIIEAVSLLSEYKCVKVIYFDEYLPDELLGIYPECNKPIILSLLIKKGSEFSISSERNQSTNNLFGEDFKQLIGLLTKQKDQYQNFNKRVTWNWKNHAKT